ncbi:MAG: rRNA maturation RNase YbeY [Dehalococcoidales bacterium]|nr:rRNA maturation RNase YbeY [Dehalococcoidales bacterium]
MRSFAVLSLAKMGTNILIDREYREKVKAVRLKKVVRRILEAEKVSLNSEVELVITGDEKVHALNKQYLDEDRTTDVLSFPMCEQAKNQTVFVSMPDGKIHLGEIIISYPQTVKQAEEHNHPVEREMLILIIHGVLHLLGYDHDTPGRKKVMWGRASKILKTIVESGL